LYGRNIKTFLSSCIPYPEMFQPVAVPFYRPFRKTRLRKRRIRSGIYLFLHDDRQATGSFSIILHPHNFKPYSLGELHVIKTEMTLSVRYHFFAVFHSPVRDGTLSLFAPVEYPAGLHLSGYPDPSFWCICRMFQLSVQHSRQVIPPPALREQE